MLLQTLFSIILSSGQLSSLFYKIQYNLIIKKIVFSDNNILLLHYLCYRLELYITALLLTIIIIITLKCILLFIWNLI